MSAGVLIKGPRTIRPVVPSPKNRTNSQKGVGGRYDLVLACQPDAEKDYSFFDEIVRLVSGMGLEIYSPHDDFRGEGDLIDVVRFTTTEAIPATRGILMHMNPITPELEKMFNASSLNHKPFILLYPQQSTPFSYGTRKIVESDAGYRGNIAYPDTESAIRQLSISIRDLIERI